VKQKFAGRFAQICRRISVSPERERRWALVKEAEAVITEMRENAIQNFGGRSFIMENLNGLEDEIRALAGRPLAFKGDNVCPVCGHPPMAREEFSPVCDGCTDRIYDYRERLASAEGFRTCNI
jgi:hypothetical protein